MANPAYATPGYRRDRARVLADGPMCAHCRCRVATEADHQPPLRLHPHVDGTGCCQLVPSCSPCARRQGAILAGRGPAPRPALIRPAAAPAPTAAHDADGWPADDPIWDVPWLSGLRRVPADATWPRLMTPPHPSAVGSYGADLAAYALERTGRPLRWWQRLVAARALEHDDAGTLCWDAIDPTVARQVGKSHLMREACLWRIHQGDRWDEPQLVVHTGKDLPVCVEIQRPARRWARGEQFADVYKVRDANGQETIELLADGSRWLVKAKESVYGLSASMAVVDEAWAVLATIIEEGLVPTMVEHASAQLWLVSTAHRKATGLMVARRNVAVADLAGTDADLWIEWSAAPGADLDDEQAWRQASPHWTDRRRRLIAQRLAAARSGESDDPDEPDPYQAFAAQWLNRWPTVRRRAGHGEPLLGAGVWDACAGALDHYDGPGIVALNDNNKGDGAAAAFVATDGAGRYELDGSAYDTWTEAIKTVRGYVTAHPGARIIVGAAMKYQLPADLPGRMSATKAGSTEVGRGLSVLRALCAERRIVHDGTVMLDDQIARARVHSLAGGGLGLVNNNVRTDLLRATLWALDAAQITPPTPAVR